MATLCENYPSTPAEAPLQLISGSVPIWAFRIVDPTTCLVPTGGISGHVFTFTVYDPDGTDVLTLNDGTEIVITSAANGIVQLEWTASAVALLSPLTRYSYKLFCTVGSQSYVAARGPLDLLP